MPVTSPSRSDQICPDLIPSESDLLRRIDSAKTNDQIEFLLTEINELMRHKPSLEDRQVLRRCRQKVYDRRKKFRDQNEEYAMTGSNIVEFPPIKELQNSQLELLHEVKELKQIMDSLRKSQAASTEALQSLDAMNNRLSQAEAGQAKIDADLKQNTKAIKSEISDLRKILEALSHPQNSHAAKTQDFLSAFSSQICKLDGATCARYFPLATFLAALAGITCWFVADQVTPLYQAFGFDQPELAAWGSIGLAVGFSGLYGALDSRQAALMCFMVAIYEVLFVMTGTMTHEKASTIKAVMSQPELVFAQKSLEKAKDNYEKKKVRFEDPKDEVYQNSWYEKKFLTPSWNSYKEALDTYKSHKMSELSSTSMFSFQGLLKLLYRLGAVVLAMILTGLAVSKTKQAFVFSE